MIEVLLSDQPALTPIARMVVDSLTGMGVV
jgi:hypothetical protein